MRDGWNHDIRYHGFVLDATPRPCANALEVGCGGGLLARELAARCDNVVGIDLDAEVVRVTARAARHLGKVTFVTGDVMSYPLPESGFDLIAAVATLHHLPLEAALKRLRTLLAPGGVLVVVGLYREETVADMVFAAAGWVTSQGMRRFRRLVEVDAPMKAPTEALAEIRTTAHRILPGSLLRRRLLFRYTMVWRKSAT
jgi:SAM-dependent methyltransferase